MIVLLGDSIAEKITFTSAPFNHTGRTINDTTTVDYTINHNLGRRIKYLALIEASGENVLHDFQWSRNDLAGCGIRQQSWFMLTNEENSVSIRSARISTVTISIYVYVEA